MSLPASVNDASTPVKAGVFLVGMPGSGKSTVGRALARRLQVDLADSDLVIEQRVGCTIRDYFDRCGEAAFRDVEELVLDELTRLGSLVLATGGGAVLRPVNRQRLHERGTVIYLRSSPEQLVRRLRNDVKRPLLQGGGDQLERLRDLYAQRDPLYRECAHFVVDAGGVSLAALVNRVLMQIELMPPQPPQRLDGPLDAAPGGPPR